jgi:hypothetical protein
MANKEKSSSSVRIGNVQGGITNSMIAGGNISHATINVGGRDMAVNSTPNLEEFNQLLMEIRADLEKLTADPNVLKSISPAVPYTVEGAKASLEAAVQNAGSVENTDISKGEAIQKSVGEATSLLGTVLDSAKTVAEKATAAGKSAKSLVETLGPVVEKLAVAGLWVARIWLAH